MENSSFFVAPLRAVQALKMTRMAKNSYVGRGILTPGPTAFDMRQVGATIRDPPPAIDAFPPVPLVNFFFQLRVSSTF